MSDLPSDASMYTDITNMPRKILEEHYMAQAQFLVAVIRNAGGKLTIPYQHVVDNPPRNYRIWMTQAPDTRNFILSTAEVENNAN